MNPQEPGFSPTIKRTLILALILGVAILLIILFAGYGFMSIEPKGTATGEITYELVNQSSKKTTTVKSSGPIKRLLSKGHYEVLVRQGNNTSFAVVKSAGFFTTKKVSAELSAEKGRRFIGDNPSPCMYMLKDLLLSYECAGRLTSASLHVPATAIQPTYALKGPATLDGAIEGIVPTKAGDTVIVRAPGDAEDQGPPHSAYLIGSDMNPRNGRELSGLNEEDTYTAYPYKEGILMVGKELSDGQYFADQSTQSQNINFEVTNDKNKEPYAVDARGSRIVVATTSPEKANRQNLDEERTNKVENASGEIVIKDGDATRRYKVNTKYVSVKLCGTTYLCTLAGGETEVFDVSGKQLKSVYRVQNVQEMLVTDAHLVLVRGSDVMTLDVAMGKGAVQYHLENYTACGMQATGNSYTLCLINERNKKVALYIDQQGTTDGIDQKVAELLKTPEIRTLSMYGSFIHIAPEVGQRTFQPSLGHFGYAPSKVSSANKAIKEAVAAAGIDTTKYFVKNTLE